jgi:hypothetical protein
MQNSALIIAAQPTTARPERQCFELGRGIGKAQDYLWDGLFSVAIREADARDPSPGSFWAAGHGGAARPARCLARRFAAASASSIAAPCWPAPYRS